MCTLTEALVIFEENLPEVKDTLLWQVHDEVTKIPKPIDTENEILADIQKQIYELRVHKVADYRTKVINRITAHINAKIQPERYRNRITDSDIAKAKDVPIEDLYDGKLVRGCGLCPFHDERRPSFSVKNNRFTCFGCGLWGSSIDFVMRRDGIDFISAVKKLI